MLGVLVNRSDRQRVFQWQVLGGRPVTTAVRAYMTPHEIDLRFAAEIARMKKLIIDKNKRDGLWLLAAAVAGLLVAGVAAWFGLMEPEMEPDRTFGEKMKVSAAVGMLVSVIGFVICFWTDTPAAPYCPRCSYCWGVAENVNEWLNWNCCPSCGLKVNDDAEAKEKESGEDS